MTTATLAGGALCKAFVTAVLLTGSGERAEAAVMEGIASDDAADLLARTVGSLRGHGDDGEAEAQPSLPPELRRVLRLPTEVRRTFVLRVLLEWSRERCADWLAVDVAEIDRTTRLAVLELAHGAL